VATTLNMRLAWMYVATVCQTNPVETPVKSLFPGRQIRPRTESEDIRSLRAIASQTMDIVSQSPGNFRV